MYTLTLKQEAEIRKFAVQNEILKMEEIATMTDREVQEKVFENYVPILVEAPQSADYNTKKDFYLIYKDNFDCIATLFIC